MHTKINHSATTDTTCPTIFKIVKGSWKMALLLVNIDTSDRANTLEYSDQYNDSITKFGRKKI